jgi:hypothetical protein
MENTPSLAPYSVTTLQLRFTGPATAVLSGSTMPTTFNARQNHRVPVPGERFRLFTSKGPVLFEVIEREFEFLAERTTVSLTLDIPAGL